MTISEQLTIFDVLPMEPHHVVHLENDFGGVRGECPCGFFFVGVTDPKDLMAIISEHCTPIASD